MTGAVVGCVAGAVAGARQQKSSTPRKTEPAAKQKQTEAQMPPAPGVRTTQAYLVALGRLLTYLSRAQLGVLLPILTQELGLTSGQQGYLMSRFSTGYLATQIAGGILADKVGGYPVMLVASLCTVVCNALAPLAAGYSHEAFGLVFTVMGLVQGMVFPAGTVVCAQWLLPTERSWATSIMALGSAVGAVIVNACAPPLAAKFGWQSVFYVNAAICGLFSIAWALLAASSPHKCSRTTEEEISLLKSAGVLKEQEEDKKEAKALLPPPSFFLHPCVGVLFFAHFAQNWQQYFMEWLPLFYTSRLGILPQAAGLHVAAITLVEVPARALTKSLPEMMLRNGYSLLNCRKLMSVQGFAAHTFFNCLICALLNFVPMASLGSSAAFEATCAFTTIFALSKASQAVHAGGYFANYLDLTRNYSGALSGVGNTVATLAGVIFPRLASWTLEATGGHWMPLVGSLLSVNCMAMVAISTGMSVDSLDDRAVAKKMCIKTPKRSAD
eukprot:CAMPEP_0197632488 /NCGR_PEP_ID=MMETSP1338-20131121/9213_1 /TAXON_ID=43686 ORGANISM="Pelagodinium beii, Strain RCC1491" /NCGR_SAMPLE_ID=MMETSP1338 /ASSEMBLY_ACC=CAM_ASM_000754 /LENGTH=497 /DNA_ID=CAMNT_0043204053 /DNA_START=133 /DNA_END=1626 /DNA_ORIENTATION=-